MTLNEILTNPYIAPVIVAGVTTLGAALGRLIVAQWRKVRNQLDEAQAAAVERYAALAARWVEQTTEPGTPGNERLEKAVDFVLTQAKARGISADRAFVVACVEAAVLGLTNPDAAPAQ